MANEPALILLEHPTAPLASGAESVAFGEALLRTATSRGFGFVALSEDEKFAEATRATRLVLKPSSGKIGKRGWFG